VSCRSGRGQRSQSLNTNSEQRQITSLMHRMATPAPKKPGKTGSHYSGKKEDATVTRIIVIVKRARSVWVSGPHSGRQDPRQEDGRREHISYPPDPLCTKIRASKDMNQTWQKLVHRKKSRVQGIDTGGSGHKPSLVTCACPVEHAHQRIKRSRLCDERRLAPTHRPDARIVSWKRYRLHNLRESPS